MKSLRKGSKRQKEELLDKIKQQEAEIGHLEKLTPQELINEVKSYKEVVTVGFWMNIVRE